MVDEPHNTPQDDEPEETQDDEIQHDNLSAGIIKESDFETVDADDDEAEVIEFLPDDETELLPTLPDDSDLAADWKKIQESEDGYLPGHEPESIDDETDNPTNTLADDVLDDVSESLEKVEDALAEEIDFAEFVVEREDEVDSSGDLSEVIEDADEAVEVEATPYIPERPKPEWKVHAEQMRAEKEAKSRKMIEDRRAYEAAKRAEREAHLKEIREGKREADERIKAQYQKHQDERQNAVEDTMQRMREERERKEREMAAAREQLKREREEKSYLNHRNADSSAASDEAQVESKPVKSPPVKRDTGLDARTSRLSKPEEDE